MCLYRGFDYVCACPDISNGIPCQTTPSVFVPRRKEDDSDYVEENNEKDNLSKENDEEDEDDFDDEEYTAEKETMILLACAIVTVLLIVIVSAILCKYLKIYLIIKFLINKFELQFLYLIQNELKVLDTLEVDLVAQY